MREGWEMKKLGMVCEITMGQSPDGNTYNTDGVGLPLINGPVEFGKGHFAKTVKTKFTTSPTKLCKENDLILCVRGSTTGKTNIAGFDACIGRGVASIRYQENQEWVNYFIYANRDNIYKLGTGATFPNVSGQILSNLQLPFPSLKEQQRIVSILDEAFAVIDQAKENVQRNLQNAKELFQSELNSVFSNGGDGWQQRRLGDVAFVKSGGTPSRSKKEYWEGNIPWYSSGELNNLYTENPERHINDLAIENSNSKLFPKGSLLIGMYDTAALKMSILDRDGTFNQAIAGIKPNDEIDLIFILHSINAIKPYLLSQRRGVRQKNLSLEKIKDISLFIPSLKIQQSIVRQLDTLSIETKKLESLYQQKLNSLEELKKGILQKAFSGELIGAVVGA